MISLAAGLATGAGALPAVVFGVLPVTWGLLVVGLTAGIMVAVALLGLVLPSVAVTPAGALAALAAGAGATGALDRMLGAVLARPAPGRGRAAGRKPRAALRHGLLVWFAIALHNVPEGIAVGAACASPAPGQALLLATAIGVHNVPEGLAIATPLVAAGLSPWRSWAAATAAGLMEPLAAAAAYLLVRETPGWLPASQAFAGGAMLYVVFGEMCPTLWRAADPRWGAVGLAAGACLGLVLDRLLG